MSLATVAQDLGESEELLDELTVQMDSEDGLIRVYGTDEHPVMSFSDDGIECLRELTANHRSEQITTYARPSTVAYKGSDSMTIQLTTPRWDLLSQPRRQRLS